MGSWIAHRIGKTPNAKSNLRGFLPKIPILFQLILFLFQLNDFGPIAANSTFLVQFSPILAKSIKLTFIQVFPTFPRFPFIYCRIIFVLFMNYCLHPLRVVFAVFGAILCLNAEDAIPPLVQSFIILLLISNPMVQFNSIPSFSLNIPPGNVCNEAASIFEQTNSRSLVIAGASRFAVRGLFVNS